MTISRAWLWILLAPLACSVSGTVSNGYPALVEACLTADDCGGPFQCIDGGCEILSCEQTAQCPAGLGCKHAFGESQGQCTFCDPATCDAGISDGG